THHQQEVHDERSDNDADEHLEGNGGVILDIGQKRVPRLQLSVQQVVRNGGCAVVGDLLHRPCLRLVAVAGPFQSTGRRERVLLWQIALVQEFRGLVKPGVNGQCLQEKRSCAIGLTAGGGLRRGAR